MNEVTPEVAAAYARKSSHQQERSLPEQIKGMKEAAEKAGRPLPDDLIFTDENSGTTEKNRTGMAALKKAARDGTLKARGVTHLYYWATDRVARNLLDSLLFEAEMARAGIKCLSVSEGYDLDTLGGKMAFTIRSLLAEQQNKRRASDIKRGQRSAIIDGKYIFEAPYGYTKNEAKRLCVNIPQAAVIRRIFNLLLSGQSPRQITRLLNELKVPSPRGKKWQHAYVASVLRQEVYAGIIVHGIGKNKGRKNYTRDSAIIEPFHHPAIFDWDTFVRAQKILSERSRLRRFTTTVRHFYLLGGLKLLRCGSCGRSVAGKRCVANGVNYFYYTCMSRNHTGVSCGLSAIPCKVLNEIVLGQLEAYADRTKVELAWAKHHKDIAPQVIPAREEITAIDQKLRGLRQRKERMAAAFAEAEVALPVLKAEVKKLTDEEQSLENRRLALQQQIEKISKTMADGGILDKLADFRKTFDGLTREGKKLLIRSFVESVTIKAKDQFEIRVRFLPQPLTVRAAKPDGRSGEEARG
jgi:site-specific DNA recombinase